MEEITYNFWRYYMKWLEKHMYITEKRFDLEDYRKPIVWFDKMLVTCGLLGSIVGQLLCLVWALNFVKNDMQSLQPLQILISGAVLWLGGQYFYNTGNRGLIYYHMDFLAEYLERKLTKKD